MKQVRPSGPVAIYQLTCLVSGKRYIGITIRKLPIRWKAHLRDATARGRCPLHRAIAKYGAETFNIEQIASAKTWGDACAAEKDLIHQERTITPSGYNLTGGGEGMLGYSREFTAEYREKLSKAARSRKYSDDERRAISERQRGRKITEATRIKMSTAQQRRVAARGGPKSKLRSPFGRGEKLRGQKRSLETCAKIAAAVSASMTPEHRLEISRHRLGMRFSDEHLKNLSLAHQGKALSDAQKAAISRALTGHERSPEHCAKLSEAKRAWWARRKGGQDAAP